PELRRTLALTHADFRRLLRHRHVGEDADPHAPGALHVTRQGTAGRLDLARGYPLRLDRLQAERPEIQAGRALGRSVNTALELLPEFGALWLQHDAFPNLPDACLRLRVVAPTSG